MLLATPVLAHGGRLPFDQWGGFTGAVLRCQRVVSQAAAQCAESAWAARRACREAALSGRQCDAAEAAARIADARRAAQDAVDAACTERQAIALQFLGSFDLQQDLIAYCRDWEHAADSAAFGGPAADAPCGAAVAASVTDVMQYVLRNRRRCMDRVAATAAGDPARAPFLDGAERRLSRAVDRAAMRLTARCPSFAAHYGRPARDLLATVAARADCVGGGFYIQDRVLCAAPVCGNGVIEADETCDDGNLAEGDACPATCRQ